MTQIYLTMVVWYGVIFIWEWIYDCIIMFGTNFGLRKIKPMVIILPPTPYGGNMISNIIGGFHIVLHLKPVGLTGQKKKNRPLFPSWSLLLLRIYQPTFINFSVNQPSSLPTHLRYIPSSSLTNMRRRQPTYADNRLVFLIF